MYVNAGLYPCWFCGVLKLSTDRHVMPMFRITVDIHGPPPPPSVFIMCTKTTLPLLMLVFIFSLFRVFFHLRRPIRPSHCQTGQYFNVSSFGLRPNEQVWRPHVSVWGLGDLLKLHYVCNACNETNLMDYSSTLYFNVSGLLAANHR
jgi:hypothetical protein